LPVIKDYFTGGIGPAAAIHAALLTATSRYIFAIAVDMPFFDVAHIRHMMALIEKCILSGNYPDALIPINGKHKEAMYGFYSINTKSVFEEEIGLKNYAMHRILTKFNTIYMEEEENLAFDVDLTMFTNLNYIDDLGKIERLAKRHKI
jgi:molybdopterin-guanine dinucleotide biosynthesis protein A